MKRTIALIIAVCWVSPAFAQSPGAFASFERASEAVLDDPHDLTIGPDGRLYVADKFGDRIAVFDRDTLELVESFGEGQMFGVHDISFGPDGLAYIAATGLGAVLVFDVAKKPPEMTAAMGGFPRTEGALAHSSGTLYVMASGTGVLSAIRDGKIIARADGFFGAHDVAEGVAGTLWVADNNARRLVQLSPDLEVLKILDDPKFGFLGPRYLDVDDFGHLVVADQDAHQIMLIDPESETLLGVLGDGFPGLGPGRFDDPEGVAVLGNEFYVSDSDNNRIVKYVVVTN